MTIKVLFLNSNLAKKIDDVSKNINLYEASFQILPTLHDFHVLIIDTEEIFNSEFWTKPDVFNNLDAKSKIFEQINSGGITFCFCSMQKTSSMAISDRSVARFGRYHNEIDNYFFKPSDLGISFEYGDTFSLENEELRYFLPLFKNHKIPLTDICYTSHFHILPKDIRDTRILGRNRAGYPVFIEILMGSGKLIMLPYFKDKSAVVKIIINEILPQIFKDENIEYLEPKWLKSYDISDEKELRNKLTSIQNTKKLLFTQSKTLEKSVEMAFSLLGFDAKRLNIGSHADIIISDADFRGLLEVKGHSNRQARKVELSQLFSAMAEMPESHDITKGIFIVNHEFEKSPEDRSKEGFTQDAIHLAEMGGIALICTVDLFPIIMGIIQNQIDKKQIEIIRNKIKNCSGIVNFNE